MIQIENNSIKILVNPLGAELSSMYSKENKIEYVWQAGKEWAKHSPVLFPIVGALQDNTYFYNGNKYMLPRHGFAREKMFSIVDKTSESVTFRLQYDEETLQVYPFKFTLDVAYTLLLDTLQVSYIVTNVGEEKMYFSLGAHPAFNVPIEKGKNYEDYYLEFDKELTENIWLLDGGLISNNSISYLQNQSKLPLQKSLFEKDALVFKGFNSNTITVTDSNQNHGFEFHLNSCPFLGLWAASNADFICIEPWYGIADSVNTNQKLQDKEGILFLNKNEEWKYNWAVRVY